MFFTNGGADAAENAIRMARLHTGKHTGPELYRSYHGNTGAAITATGATRGGGRTSSPTATSASSAFLPTARRSGRPPEEECERALQHLEQVIQFEGADTIGAILIETVVGTAGS